MFWPDLQTFLVETIPHYVFDEEGKVVRCPLLNYFLQNDKISHRGYSKKKKKNRNKLRTTPVLESLFSLETPTQMFSCEYSEISKKTYFKEHLRTAASELTLGSDCLGLCFWLVAFKPEL